MDFKIARKNMVENQIRANKVTSLNVINAFLDVPREKFVPDALQEISYVDEDIQLSRNRFMMKPMILARLFQSLNLKGKENISFSGREIPYSLGVRSLVILVLSLFIVLFIIFIVMIIEDQYNHAHLTFEIFSAFATNGMSTGTSSVITEFSKIIFILGMCIGRLGPMTLALLISGSKKQIEYRFFEEKVRIG